MDTKLLTTFIEVSRCGSFATAARYLDQDPSSISRSVAQLEQQLGVRLFQRTTRKVSLTEAGVHYAKKIEPILNELEQANEEAKTANSHPVGKLKLSTSVAFGVKCVLPLLGEFQNRYPGITLDLKLSDENIDLFSERIDLAIRLGASIDVNVVARKLINTHYRVCASKQYLSNNNSINTPEDLVKHPSLCFDLPKFSESWIFDDGSSVKKEIPIQAKFTSNNALALKSAAISGMGPALLADWLIEEDLENGTLVDVFPNHKVTATNFDTAAWFLFPSRQFLPLKTRIMMEFLVDKLGNSQHA